MKWTTILTVLIAGVFGLHILGTLVTTKIRFRLTVNVETPTGPKTGSSVMETVFYRESAFSRLFTDKVRLDGEAVLVDLGAAPDGKRLNLLALLVLGPRGSDASAASLPVGPGQWIPADFDAVTLVRRSPRVTRKGVGHAELPGAVGREP